MNQQNRILASELINDLKELIEQHGDLPVFVRADDYGWFSGFCLERNLRSAREDESSVSDCFVICA